MLTWDDRAQIERIRKKAANDIAKAASIEDMAIIALNSRRTIDRIKEDGGYDEETLDACLTFDAQ